MQMSTSSKLEGDEQERMRQLCHHSPDAMRYEVCHLPMQFVAGEKPEAVEAYWDPVHAFFPEVLELLFVWEAYSPEANYDCHATVTVGDQVDQQHECWIPLENAQEGVLEKMILTIVSTVRGDLDSMKLSSLSQNSR